MSYLKDREIWLSNVPTDNPPAGYVWVFIQNGKVVVRDSSGNNQMMVATSGSQAITGSLTVTGGITGTVSSASYVEYSNVANKPALVSGSSQVTYSGLTGIPSGIVSGSAQIASFGIFATTGSNGFNGSQSITGSLTVTGQVVAQTLNVQQVTSSVVYSSGSNVFGNSLSNTQQFTGSVSVTGSFVVTTTGTELQVTSTGVNLGNALTDSHIISGSLRVNPNGLFVSGSGIVGVGTILPSERFEVNTGQGARAGMALTGEYPYLRFNVSSSSANARNWAFNATNAEPGDFALLQSTSKDGNPVTAGTSILGFGRNGAATFSSSVTTSQLVSLSPSGTAALFLKDASANNKWEIGHITNNLYFYNYTTGTNPLVITGATGAAIFGSSVTAGGSGNVILGVDVTYPTYNTIGFGGTLANGQNRIFAGNISTNDGVYLQSKQGISFWVNGTSDVGSITSNGYVRLTSASGGIQFNGDTAAANALDDYEEGTWTPVVKIGTTTNSGSAVGKYTKIGNVVYIQATITSITKSSTGGLTVEGLPFTIGTSFGEGHGVLRWGGITSNGVIYPYFNSGNTNIIMQDFSNTGYVDTIQHTQIGSTYQLYGISGFYMV